MTPVEMRIAKRELHKVIVDNILIWEPDNDELNELWDYVKTLAEIEKNA